MHEQFIDEDTTYRKIAIRIVPVLVACYVLAFLDRSNIGYAKLQFDGDLGFSEAVYGLGGGFFYLGYSLFEVPSNLILARIGARKTMARIMVLWSLAASALAFIGRPVDFYVLRFLLGVAEAGFFPGVLFYLTLWIPPSRRARFTMMFMSAIILSGIIGGPISGFIMQEMAGLLGLRGWQWLFLVEGLPAALSGVFVYFYLDDGPATASWLSIREKEFIALDLRTGTPAAASSSHASLGSALSDPRFYALTGMAAALTADIGALFLWMPTIIRRMGVSNVWHIGLMSCIPFSAALVAQYLIARRSDRRQERIWHAVIPALVAGVTWMLLPSLGTSPAAALALLTIVAIGTFGATGPYWTLPAKMLSGTAAAGGIAVITTVGGIGAFFSPAIAGYLTARTGRLDFALYYYGALMVAGALMLLAARDRR